MLTVGLTIFALACFTAVFKWRWALIICVIVGLLQNPLRKITPGAPVVYVGFVAMAFASAYLGALIANVRLTPSVIHGWRQDLRLLHAIRWRAMDSGDRRIRPFGSLMLPLIGMIFYVAPILAVTFAYELAIRIGSVGIWEVDVVLRAMFTRVVL